MRTHLAAAFAAPLITWWPLPAPAATVYGEGNRLCHDVLETAMKFNNMEEAAPFVWVQGFNTGLTSASENMNSIGNGLYTNRQLYVATMHTCSEHPEISLYRAAVYTAMGMKP